MSEKNRHVVPQDGDWAVKKPGAERASEVLPTQEKAIARAREIAQQTGGEVVIHGRDGRIRDKDSYGRDPFPPKDKKH